MMIQPMERHIDGTLHTLSRVMMMIDFCKTYGVKFASRFRFLRVVKVSL